MKITWLKCKFLLRQGEHKRMHAHLHALLFETRFICIIWQKTKLEV